MNRLSVLLVIVVCCALRALAGDSPRSVRAVRTAAPPRIDGVLDDAAWSAAEPTAGFIQRDPDEGRPGSEPTEVRVLYDDDALYVAFRMTDSDPAGIVGRLTRRDDEIESDYASIRLDAYHDHQTGYEFTFNAAGVKTDILQYDDGDKEDASWDPVWDVQVGRDGSGWTAEVRIPFRILRYRSGEEGADGQTWGVNFIRYISRKQETQRWAFTPKSESGFISRFGHLTGLKDLPDSRQIELLPFMVTKQAYEPANGPRGRRQDLSANAGVDLRYGLTKSFTLDATVNPDFGQVEADPAVLNLSTYETFYPEKRPFFIDGTQIIRFSTFGGDFGPGMFYSRRIGRAISPFELAVPSGGRIVDAPEQATILGAAKLSGRTEGGLSIGLLQAVTQEEKGEVADAAGNVTAQVLEPFAHYGILRLKQEVLGGSYVGTILTSTAKDGRNPAFTNGYDWNLRLAENTYTLIGFLALSRATNRDGERIEGSAGKLAFSRVAAEHWLWSVSGDFTSTKYNINDVGFFFSPDDIGHNATLTYKETTPAAVVRSYSISGSYHQRWTFEGANIARDVRLTSGLLFANYWELSLSAGTSHGRYDHRETRGNGLYEKPFTLSGGFEVSTDDRNDVVVTLSEEYTRHEHGGEQFGTGVGVGVRPLSWLQCTLIGEYNRSRNVEAWVTNADTGTGRMSIFGDRATDQHGLTLRTTLTFTRELTLQYYGQIFLAKGSYRNYRRLLDPARFEPYPAAPDLAGEDFNSHALNSNLVLRWEYLPGSTLYLVWSQARAASDAMPFSALGDDLRETFRTAPANVILLKASYWLTL